MLNAEKSRFFGSKKHQFEPKNKVEIVGQIYFTICEN